MLKPDAAMQSNYARAAIATAALAFLLLWTMIIRPAQNRPAPPLQQAQQAQSIPAPQCHIVGSMYGPPGVPTLKWERVICIYRDGRMVEAETAPAIKDAE